MVITDGEQIRQNSSNTASFSSIDLRLHLSVCVCVRGIVIVTFRPQGWLHSVMQLASRGIIRKGKR